MEQKVWRPGELLFELLDGESYDDFIAQMDRSKAAEPPTESGAARKTPTIPIRHLSGDDRREYNRAAKRKSREGQRARAAAGSLDASPQAIRDALADAALIILATGDPGIGFVRRALSVAFPDKVDLSVTIEAKARAGRLQPKLLELR